MPFGLARQRSVSKTPQKLGRSYMERAREFKNHGLSVFKSLGLSIKPHLSHPPATFNGLKGRNRRQRASL